MQELLTSNTVQALRREVRAALVDRTDTPDLDADLLISDVLNVDRLGLLLEGDRALSSDQLAALDVALNRRLSHEPMAYVLGKKAFRTIDLIVDSRVLVPRPETEWLVDFALNWIEGHSMPARVLDLGTGSGAIALAIASETEDIDGLEITGVDVSEPALDVAIENGLSLGLDQRVSFHRSDLLEQVDGKFDLILANLPYLRDDQRHASIQAEPDLALYAGSDGLDLYRRMFDQLDSHVTSRGVTVLEIDPDQRDTLLNMVEDKHGWVGSVHQDLAGLDRYFVLRRTAECKAR